LKIRLVIRTNVFFRRKIRVQPIDAQVHAGSRCQSDVPLPATCVRHRNWGQDPLYQKLLQQLGSVDKATQADKHRGNKILRGLTKVVIAGLDVMIDPFGSLFRRRRAAIVMELLGEGLIGPQQAATRHHDVLNRQEYGPIRAWLDKRRA